MENMDEEQGKKGSQDLSGQVVLLTGGSRGLGRAYAVAMAQTGATVAVTARSENDLAESVRLIEEQGGGGRALALPLDVTDAEAVARVVAMVERELGPLDILVNNAGVMSPLGPDWEVDPDRWWQTFEVNVHAPFLMARAVVPGMIARGRGRIINVSSGAANKSHPHATAYSASKAAITNWAGGLAAAVTEQGITVFAWDPGFVRTAMSEHLAQSDESRRWFGESFQHLFEKGQDTPIERSIEQFMLLASGQMDALSGRHLSVGLDLLDLARRAEEVEKNDWYTLRLRTPPPVPRT
jgi:NAD(P)-dependent dehydrogenase (short-subunit alcohol dehydrogenase family)